MTSMLEIGDGLNLVVSLAAVPPAQGCTVHGQSGYIAIPAQFICADLAFCACYTNGCRNQYLRKPLWYQLGSKCMSLVISTNRIQQTPFRWLTASFIIKVSAAIKAMAQYTVEPQGKGLRLHGWRSEVYSSPLYIQPIAEWQGRPPGLLWIIGYIYMLAVT